MPPPRPGTSLELRALLLPYVELAMNSLPLLTGCFCSFLVSQVSQELELSRSEISELSLQKAGVCPKCLFLLPSVYVTPRRVTEWERVPRKNSFYLLKPPLFPTGHFFSSGLWDALLPNTSHMSLKLSMIFSTGLWTCRKDCVLYLFASMVARSVDTQRFMNTKLLDKWDWQIIS